MGTDNENRPGKKMDIDTPALLIDLDKMEFNISKMAGFFRDKTANVRPHFKTPKCTNIALRQIEAGAHGITCAKVSEAEVLMKAGVKDILIANQVVGSKKINRLLDMLNEADVKVAVDSEHNIRELAQAAAARGLELGCLIEINVGLPRCGVSPERAPDLARLVESLSGLELKGVMGYEGHVVAVEDKEHRDEGCLKSMAILIEAKDRIEEAGLACEIVSAGGTGTYQVSGTYPGVTEVQAGSYVMMDAKYAKLGLGFEKAVTILSQVISIPSHNMIIIDAGIKTMTYEFGWPELIGVPNTRLGFLSEEHGHLLVEGEAPDIKIGDKVELYPTHICTTVNLHDKIYACRGDQVEDVWPIEARGCSQ
jgi:D-serine deaminase-like pyridoxal phosphate-dependent protein